MSAGRHQSRGTAGSVDRMVSFGSRALVVVGAVALPLLASQLLPSANPDRWSPVAVVLHVLVGGLLGWSVPTPRAWMYTTIWVAVGAALILVSWTDLVLNVSPVIMATDVWRTETFVAILASIGLVSVGFVVGAVIRRRGALGPLSARGAAPVLAVAALGVVIAAATAQVSSASALVLQDDSPRVTVRVTDAGIEVSPANLGTGDVRLIVESAASTPAVLVSIIPLSADAGLPRAMTDREIDLWLSGDWAALGPAFPSAVTWVPLTPGERRDGGPFGVIPSPDGTGGAFWYVAEVGEPRSWPAGASEGDPEPVPWPVVHHVVVPVGGP